MATFLRSLFSSTPKPVQLVSGHRVAHTKTVQEILGESFDYGGSIRANSAFCKRILKWCAREDSTENILFLLMYQKYCATPSSALFDHICSEFIGSSAPREINISGKSKTKITVVSQLEDRSSSMGVFDSAASDVRTNAGDSLARLRSAPFETAFTLTASGAQARFDNAIGYLRGHQINLL